MNTSTRSKAAVALIVPCYNEAERLDTAQFLEWAKASDRVIFVFVDDGSSDATWEVLVDLAQQNPERLHAHQLESNQGKAEAVRRGINYAIEACSPEYFGYWDADLATPLAELPRFIETLDENETIDMVLGSRVKLLGRQIERDPVRHYLGRIFATAASLTLRLRVYDTQCGAKLFRTNAATSDAFEAPFTTRWVFDVQMLQRYLRSGTKDSILELPLHKWVDVAGSKVRPTDFFVAFFDLLSIALQRKR